jgi:hypothetical protein
MANSAVAITAGAGTNIDTFTMASGDHRQAVVIGDPSADNVATVKATGALVVDTLPHTTGAATSVAAAAADTTLLASNANRRGATFFNESTATLYLLLANATSSITVYTVQVPPYGYYEAPFAYSGVVKGIWSSATGNVRVTEITD